MVAAEVPAVTVVASVGLAEGALSVAVWVGWRTSSRVVFLLHIVIAGGKSGKEIQTYVVEPYMDLINVFK